MPEHNPTPPSFSETTAILDGKTVLVIKVNGEIRGVQGKRLVERRVADLGRIIDDIDTALAKSDDDHFALANKRLDDAIARLTTQKAALTPEGVAAAADAALTKRRTAVVAQRDHLSAVLPELTDDAQTAGA
jgi:hypothetical protein